MNIKSLIKNFIRKRGGYVFGPGTVPKGIDLFHDLRRFGYSPNIKTVFDIGANVGLFARAATASLPGSRLFCFEPIRSTFDVLKQTLATLPGAKGFHSAMGSTQGQLRMTSKPGSMLNHVLGPDEAPGAEDRVELVRVDTVVDAAVSHDLSTIDLLKTDTEGYDLEVLRGAAPLIAAGQVFLVLVEVGFSDIDKGHTPFAAVRSFLKEYDVVGFYGQGMDANFSALDRADALFIHRETARRLLPSRW